MKGAMDAVNRILEYYKMDAAKAALSGPFKHLGDISSMRDDLLHYGAQEDELGELFVSNVQRKHLVERATTRRISVADLGAMTGDLRIICNHFTQSMWPLSEWQWPSEEVRAAYEAEMRAPWRYKPRSPVPLPNKRP